MKPSKFVIILSLVLTCVAHMCREVLAADGPATRPSAKIVSSDPLSTSIEIPIAQGQTYFAAYGSDVSLLVNPILGGRFTEDGRLICTFVAGQAEDGDQKFWRVKVAHRLTSGRSQSGVTSGEFTFRNGLTSQASTVTSDDIPLVIEDVSKATALSGLALYRFPYAKVGDETRFVVVAVASDPTVFSKLFSVSSRRNYDWTKWPEVK